jgi:hypothetical protein
MEAHNLSKYMPMANNGCCCSLIGTDYWVQIVCIQHILLVVECILMASAHYQPPCSLFDAKAIDCNLGGCIQSDDIAHPKPQYLQHLLVVTL